MFGLHHRQNPLPDGPRARKDHHDTLDLWGPALQAACGRPLWISESDRGLKHLNNPPWYDLAPSDERLKAEYMAQSHAQSLSMGTSHHFHFLGRPCP